MRRGAVMSALRHGQCTPDIAPLSPDSIIRTAEIDLVRRRLNRDAAARRKEQPRTIWPYEQYAFDRRDVVVAADAHDLIVRAVKRAARFVAEKDPEPVPNKISVRRIYVDNRRNLIIAMLPA